MIINKMIFSKEEKEQLRNPTKSSAIDIELINLKAKKRYMLSFIKDLNIDYRSKIGYSEYSAPIIKLSGSDEENVKQAIFSDVHEILSNITKRDIEEYLKNSNVEWINLSGKSEKEQKEMIKIFRQPNYQNCFRALQQILMLQLETCGHYCLNSSEILELVKKKTAELYEIPTDSPNEMEAKLEENAILPIIQKTKIPESVLYPLWKPTHEIFNNFPIGKTQKINMESEKDRRKGKTANLLMLLNFDELKGVQISRTLTIYDKNVWNACANLVKCGYGTVTAAQIYKFMGHTSEPPTKERKKILESIETLSRARVFISNKEEHTL